MDSKVIEQSVAPASYKVVTHTLSIFIPAFLGSLLLVIGLANSLLGVDGTTARNLIITLAIGWLIYFVVLIVVLLIVYTLAGGFEWRFQTLSVSRIFLCIILTGVYPGLMVVSYWLFLRSLLGALYKLSDPAIVMGRLFRFREII
jgi:hypothetical protein